MHIVINAVPLLSRLTGVGHCIYRTAKALLDIDTRNRYSFYYGYFSDKLISPAYPAGDRSETAFTGLHRTKTVVDSHPRVRAAARKIAAAWHRVASVGRRFDLYYEPNYIPVELNARRIVTTVHDLSFIRHPEWHPKDRIEVFPREFRRRIGRSDLITADSEFTRRELLELLRLDAGRVRVVHLGCDRTVFRRRSADEVERFRVERGLPRNFVLFVGSIEPRKNVHRLLEAYARLSDGLRKEFKLVLAGFSGWSNESTMRLIERMKADVLFLGYLEVEELALVYNAAAAFAYPSLYEGFGLPPLEAMACGTPVVVSNIEPLREVCGDAGSFVECESVESIAEGLRNLLADNDLRLQLSQRALERAKLFGWEITARRMLEVFEEVHRG
jgi:glycosyltransferase involved in cell wall biosynthesis